MAATEKFTHTIRDKDGLTQKLAITRLTQLSSLNTHWSTPSKCLCPTKPWLTSPADGKQPPQAQFPLANISTRIESEFLWFEAL